MIPSKLQIGAELIARSRLAADELIPQLDQNSLLNLGRHRRQFGDSAIALSDEMMSHSTSQSFEEVLATRRSRRRFSEQPLEYSQISYLLQKGLCSLWPTQTSSESANLEQRSWASAGGLHSVETFVAVNRATGLKQGIYHLDPIAKEMRTVGSGRTELTLTSDFQGHTPPSVVLILTADFAKCCAKYGLRGYRYTLMDVGHVSQVLLLIAQSLGLAAYPSARFYDLELSRTLTLDGDGLAPLLTIGVGLPAA